MELVRLRQKQQAQEVGLADVMRRLELTEHRCDSAERGQQQIVSMVQRALQNPELLSKLLSSTATKKLSGPGPDGVEDVEGLESPEATPPSEGMDLGRQLSSLPSMDSGELDLLMSMIAEPGGGGGGEPPLPWDPAPAPAPAERGHGPGAPALEPAQHGLGRARPAHEHDRRARRRRRRRAAPALGPGPGARPRRVTPGARPPRARPPPPPLEARTASRRGDGCGRRAHAHRPEDRKATQRKTHHAPTARGGAPRETDRHRRRFTEDRVSPSSKRTAIVGAGRGGGGGHS